MEAVDPRLTGRPSVSMSRGSLATSGFSPALPPVPGSSQPSAPGPQRIVVEPLKGWHLPLLSDPAFLPLQSLLQRCLLEALPQRLLQVLRLPLAPVAQVLVASRQGEPLPLGVLVSRSLNRRGSCWLVQHLRLTAEAPARPTALALLTTQIERITSASSWILPVSSLDQDRLALLREQGFQPLRSEALWRWRPRSSTAAPWPAGAGELQLRPLQRRQASLYWHLEQAACPPQLRQLLDRRLDDLLDDSRCGWMLVDSCRSTAVAGIRLLDHDRRDGLDACFSLHPLWLSALGPPVQGLLDLAAQKAGGAISFAVDRQDSTLNQWLQDVGAEPLGDQVLMVRSVWRRQVRHPVTSVALRLGAVLEQWQPPRPVPTPSLPGRPVGQLMLR